jgi:O-antigen/teichoic acid export membrane protein
MNLILLLGLVINILLNWYFIPTYKAQAAAATTLATEFIIAIGLIIIVIDEFKLQIALKPVLSLIVYGLVIFAFYHTLSVVFNLDWMISLILGIIVSFVVSLLLHIIDIRVLKEVLITR